MQFYYVRMIELCQYLYLSISPLCISIVPERPKNFLQRIFFLGQFVLHFPYMTVSSAAHQLADFVLCLDMGIDSFWHFLKYFIIIVIQGNYGLLRERRESKDDCDLCSGWCFDMVNNIIPYEHINAQFDIRIKITLHNPFDQLQTIPRTTILLCLPRTILQLSRVSAPRLMLAHRWPLNVW